MYIHKVYTSTIVGGPDSGDTSSRHALKGRPRIPTDPTNKFFSDPCESAQIRGQELPRAHESHCGFVQLRYPCRREENMDLNSRSLTALFGSTLLLAAFASAQELTIPSTGFPGLDHYRASRIAIFTDDFGQLARYRDADAALKPPGPGDNRVVFFGDSITDIWKLEDYFPDKPYLNRGIGGQTTPQMLVRFRQDAIDLHP